MIRCGLCGGHYSLLSSRWKGVRTFFVPVLPVFVRTDELSFVFTDSAFSSVTGIYSIKARLPDHPSWFSSSCVAMISVRSIRS